MLNRLSSVVALLVVGALSAHAQSGTPPVPPVPARAPVPATAPTPKTPPTPPSPAVAPTPKAWGGQWPGAIDFEAMALLDELKGLSGNFAPKAMVNIDMAAIQEQVRAGMDGQRAAIESARESMKGQQAAIESYAKSMASGFGESFSYSFSGAPSASFSTSGSFRTQAPVSWKTDDPADSLYREARKALSNDQYQRASDIFRRIWTDLPKSVYAPDAGYWYAFALQRLGGDDNLKKARSALALQGASYPKASTRSDAMALYTRISGQLARSGDQEAIANLADRSRYATSDGCPREQDDERIDALNAVASMDAVQAMPILKKVLARREACTQKLRRAAVWLVASKKSSDAADILLHVARTDPDKDVREQAVFWMANVPTEEATTMLIELAKKGDDLELRKKAVYSLSRSKSPRATATLKEIALDANADSDLRVDALSWYMQGPGRSADDATAFLKEVYGRADELRFKQRVLQTIASRRTDESRAWLVDIAQNSKESMEIRRSAIYSLNGAGVTGTQLGQIYDRAGELEIRKQVILMLTATKDDSGLNKLLEIGRSEKNPELRKTIITALGRSKDPRAVALILEIIEK